MSDRPSDGYLYGEAHGRAKLTRPQVIAARQRAKAGERQDLIAEEFGVSHRALNMAVTGKTWASVDDVETPVRVGNRPRLVEPGQRGKANTVQLHAAAALAEHYPVRLVIEEPYGS